VIVVNAATKVMPSEVLRFLRGVVLLPSASEDDYVGLEIVKLLVKDVYSAF
jgi:hypothetical protein